MSPPVDNADADTTESQRSIPTPFLMKTFNLVEDHSIDEIISWNEYGSSFVVWNPTIFSKDLLPLHFKHNNFSSFVRQLNTYGFKKVVPDRWEFSNDSFRRGKKHLLHEIQRRKLTTVPGNGGGGLSAELLEENEKLRNQNVKLNREISQMKSLCDNIFSVVSNYAGFMQDQSCSSSHVVKRFLDEEEEEEEMPRLFGVSIGLKRTKSDGVHLFRRE